MPGINIANLLENAQLLLSKNAYDDAEEQCLEIIEHCNNANGNYQEILSYTYHFLGIIEYTRSNISKAVDLFNNAVKYLANADAYNAVLKLRC